MGNGSICVSVKDYISDRNNTMQNPNTENGIFQNSKNSSQYMNTFPNNLNYSNYITINSRRWYKAGINNNINNQNTFNPNETKNETENNNNNTNNPDNLKNANKQYINDYSNNLINLSYGDKYMINISENCIIICLMDEANIFRQMVKYAKGILLMGN